MLYIITKPTFISLEMLKPLADNPDIRIVIFEKNKLHLCDNIRKFLRAYCIGKTGLWLDRFYGKTFLTDLSGIREEDKVLLFSIKNLKDLRIFSKELKAAEKNIYFWDPLSWIKKGRIQRCIYRYHLRRMGMPVYTFDIMDARKYHFIYAGQIFHYPLETRRTDTKYDIFFIGRDRHRAQTISDLCQLFQQASLSLDIHILKDKHSGTLDSLKPYYAAAYMPYVEVVNHIRSAKCLLEIVQDGQSGATLRTMEALFFQKKLITNNPYIQEYPFYSPDNILILQENTTSHDIAGFMAREYLPVDPEIVQSYHIKQWIKQFQ